MNAHIFLVDSYSVSPVKRPCVSHFFIKTDLKKIMSSMSRGRKYMGQHKRI